MSCPDVCPVYCIHPTTEEDSTDEVKHLNINPDECIDCGACAGQCPVEAIFPDSEVSQDNQKFVVENAEYFSG